MHSRQTNAKTFLLRRVFEIFSKFWQIFRAAAGHKHRNNSFNIYKIQTSFLKVDFDTKNFYLKVCNNKVICDRYWCIVIENFSLDVSKTYILASSQRQNSNKLSSARLSLG